MAEASEVSATLGESSCRDNPWLSRPHGLGAMVEVKGQGPGHGGAPGDSLKGQMTGIKPLQKSTVEPYLAYCKTGKGFVVIYRSCVSKRNVFLEWHVAKDAFSILSENSALLCFNTLRVTSISSELL